MFEQTGMAARDGMDPHPPSDGGVEWLSRLSATPVPYSYLSFSRKAVSPAQPSQHSVVRGAKRDSLPGPFIKTFSQGKTKEKKIDQTPATGLFFAFINLSFFPSNLNFIFFPPSPPLPNYHHSFEAGASSSYTLPYLSVVAGAKSRYTLLLSSYRIQ